MIDALMAGEFERCSSADLNRPLVGTVTEVIEKVSILLLEDLTSIFITNILLQVSLFLNFFL